MKKLLLILSLAITVAACEKDDPTIEQSYYFKVWNKSSVDSVGAFLYVGQDGYDSPAIVRYLRKNEKTGAIQLSLTSKKSDKLILSVRNFYNDYEYFNKDTIGTGDYTFQTLPSSQDTSYIIIQNKSMYPPFFDLYVYYNTEKW